jgi:hypothetical protein
LDGITHICVHVCACGRLHSDASIASLTGGTSPAGPAQVEVHDMIRGVVRFPADKIDDAVLLKVSLSLSLSLSVCLSLALSFSRSLALSL